MKVLKFTSGQLRFSRHPGEFNRHPGECWGPRPPQLVDFVEGVDTGHQRYGEKFDSFRVSFGITVCAAFVFFSPCTLAQTCAAGIQASNPTSVYLADSANGTVTDTRTGLMWDRCARGLSGVGCATGTASIFTWQAALNAAATIGTYKGYNDWRLPNLKELRSLVEECRINPSINEFAFPNTSASLFLSGSPYAGDATSAWGVGFLVGNAAVVGRSGAYQVRLVRAGQ